MYIIDFIFGFIPILLVVLFIIRIILTARKRKVQPEAEVKARIPPSMAAERRTAFQSSPPTTSPTPPPKPPTSSSMSPPAPPVYTEPSAAGKQYLENERNMEKREKIVLSESESYKVTGVSEAAMARLNSLPELKKAVLWSEILGKPKGL